ncbi:MAG: type II secretion system protein [Sulfuritalea sp.]|jgi:type II secretory pathway pseudopilin PulG|nr:hypothetical protein [Rhodocyclaceae bacterium]MCC7309954.1 type II secretion system protein [Sulfuritalea sp.]
MTFCRKKSVSAGRRPRQSGAALLIFLLVLMAGALAYLVSNLTSSEIEARRAQKTQQALSQAREALIGYALRYREDQMADGQYDRVYGYLPLPDLGTTRNNNAGCGNEGCDAANFAGNALNTTVIGRLPWRTLGIEPLRDAYGECLWYAVSGSHQNQQRVSPMNWDALGQVDIVDTNKPIETSALKSRIASAHDRPIAIILSAGPPLGAQDRSPAGADVVTRCGGNYDPQHYLDPSLAAALLDYTGAASASTYFTGVRATDTSAAPLAISTQGRIFTDGTLPPLPLKAACPAGSTNCALAGNDAGLPLTGDTLFAAIRKHAYFRTDINALLDRITDCLRDSGVPGGYGKITGTDDISLCYGSQAVPKGYFQHYREMIFTAPGAMQVNGSGNCAGVLLFSGQRNTDQLRATNAQKDNPPGSYDNYLEGINRSSFKTSGAVFSGQEIFERVSINQTAHQDIVRCIPAGTLPSFVTTQSSGLQTAKDLGTVEFSQLAAYSTTTRTLALGQQVHTALASSLANYLYGCAWRPETRAMGGGLRSYFTFRIDDPGLYSAWPQLGLTFAIIDGDNNGTDVCGAAGQHLGYSGNNAESPFIAPPKIAFEIDPRRDPDLYPSSSTSHLTNGRNDPPTDSANYRGGHVALVYWGGETPTTATAISPCDAPAYSLGGVCTLPQEEDDNVHGQVADARSGFPAPPLNPAAPIPRLTVPPDTPAGVYKLDPDTTSVPVNQLFHVRVELTRAPSSYNLPRVRVATTENINLGAPGTIDANGIHLFQVDGVYLFPDDRVLVKNQSDPKQNGIYVWEGADKVMKRAGDAGSVDALAGLIVEVTQGTTHARQLWRQQTVQPGTCVDPNMKPVDCTIFDWQPASVALYSNLPSTPLTGHVAYVRKGDQRNGENDWNGWYRWSGSNWQRLWANLSTQEPITNLSSAPAVIDGIAPAAGSRILVRHQANAAENGVYLWNGEGGTMGRVSGFDSGPVLAGALVQVLSGSDAGRAFRQTAMPYGGTVGTNAIQWEAIDASPHYLLEAWLLRDSPSYSQRIAAMQDTTRPMSFLIGLIDPPQEFPPHLRNNPVIPYPFRNARLGFTIGQRTSINDQTVTIGNYFTTWLP